MKNDNSNTSLKRGRPPKKDYDPEALMRELIDTAAEIYREKGEIKATALELSLPPGKVKKLLITGNVLFYPETKQIQDLMRQGKTMLEIQHIMGLSYSTLHTYLPYSKVIYKMSEISQNAERVKTYKARKSAVDTLMAAPTEGHLWDCIIAFQNYPFHTVSSLRSCLLTAGKTANLWHGALCGWRLRKLWTSKALYLPAPKSWLMSGV